MAEQYLNASSGGQHVFFTDQVLPCSANIVTVPNSYYISSSQAESLSSNCSPLDYLSNPNFEIQTYQEIVTNPSSSFVPLPENTSQRTLHNPNQGHQFLQREVSQNTAMFGTGNSMDVLTRSAIELLQGEVSQSSNNSANGASNTSVGGRNQFVSLLPSTFLAAGSTAVIGAQSNVVKTIASGTPILPKPQQQRANVGGSSHPKIIKVLSQRPVSGSAAAPKTTLQTLKRVIVRSSDGSQKNCFVVRPETLTGSGASEKASIEQNTSAPAAAMRLANSVEQEISEMIRRTCADFTIKGEDARKSGLLEIISDKEAPYNSGTAKFFCSFCKERYAQKEGFQMHFQRISFVLKYKCEKCSTIFTFFNKCALWAHLKSHSESINYGRVLRLDPFDFISNPNVFANNMKASAVSDSKEIMEKTMFNTQGIVKCPICQNFVRNLPIHLKRPDGKYHAHHCPLCKMYLPNKCSLIAHCRFHGKTCSGQNPCCPECGLTGHGLTVKDTFDHADACMHFNRSESFSCECKATFPSLAEAKKHFLEAHIKPISKCSSCSVAFTDAKLLESHLAGNQQCKQHLSRVPLEVTCLCSMCKSVLTTAIEAKLHLEKHIPPMSQLSWVCFLCSMMFPTANELRIHCEEDHPHRAKRCTTCYMLFCNRQLLVDHILSKKCARGCHSLARCADMPLKPLIDIDWIVKNLYKICGTAKNQTCSAPAAQSQKSNRKSTPWLSLNSPTLIQEKQVQSKQNRTLQEQDGDLVEETGLGSPNSAALQKQKNAVKKSNTLDKAQSALLADLRQWISKDGKEIIPTATPPSKKPGRPKKEKQPPPHLVCGVTAKGIGYQCHRCKIIVTGTHNFMTHMKYHEVKGDCNFGAFAHCSVCDKLIGSHLITKHLKEHQDQGVIVCCRCQRRDFGDMEDAIQHAHNLCEYKRIGEIVPRPLPQAKDVSIFTMSNKNPTIENEQTFNVINVDPVLTPRQTEQPIEIQLELGPTPISTDDFTSKTAAPQDKNQLYPCHLCSLIFENVVLRDQHVRKSHSGTRKVYHCLACKKKNIVKTFTNQVTARRHVTNKHRVVKPSMVDKCIKEVVSSVSSSQTKVLLAEQPEETSTEGPAPKMLRLAADGDFMCAKCGFSCPSDDKAAFGEHIRTHNPKQEPQCPECGLCFTVLNAIKRHLFAVHKIKDMDSFLAENGIVEEQEEEEDELESVMEEMLPGVRSLPRVTRQQQASSEETDKEQAEDDLDSLECNVCYRSFDSEINLKTHMRTHGMAFIRSKRYKPI